MPSDKAIGIQPILLFTNTIYDLAYNSIDSLLKVGQNSIEEGKQMNSIFGWE